MAGPLSIVLAELCNPIPKTITNVSPPAKLICHSPRMIGTVLSCFSDASRYAADSAHDRERTHQLARLSLHSTRHLPRSRKI